MKVLIVSQYYPPENVPIPAAIARGLTSRGHIVRVLTGYPNYPKGELFAGYEMRGRQRERVDGIDIWRLPLFVDHSPSSTRRMLNYLSFGVSSCFARRLARGADVIYIYATQMTAALGPWVWRLSGGVPYVLHVQDLWPDSIVGSSMLRRGLSNRTVAAVLRPWLKSVYNRSGAVISIAPTMSKTLIGRGVDPDRLSQVFNWADTSMTPGGKTPRAPGRTSDARSHTEVVYAGNVGDMQDLETAIAAAHQVRSKGLVLRIVGDGVALPRARQTAASLGASNVRFEDAVPAALMPSVYSSAHYSLVSLRDLPAFRGTIPSKFQGSLAHGVPVITTVQGDVRRIVDELDVGFSADSESVDSLAAAFAAACAEDEPNRLRRAERAERVYRSRFSQEAGITEIERVLLRASGEVKD